MPIKLLLHICCGPCSTHVAELLSKNHKIVGYFYNPNIYPYKEWLIRYEAFREMIKKCYFPIQSGNPEKIFIDYFPKESLIEKEYNEQHKKFLKAVKGLEKEPEGGKRCEICFKLRLEESCRFAKEMNLLNIATTLTIGRNKKAEIINPIGENMAQKYGVKFYAADFKKIPSLFSKEKERRGDLAGFWNSVKLSKEMGLYRQRYCGCEFSCRSN